MILISQDFSSISFPCLETDRLWLRYATQEDAEAVFAVFSDPKVTQFHDLDTFTQLDEAVSLIERWARGFKSGYRIRWGIACKHDNYLIGSCGFRWDKEANAAVVGYELASHFWRQGIMSEALYAILQYEFRHRGAELIFAQIMFENIASRRLLEKLGFQSQGILKEHGFWKGEYHDLEQLVLMRSGMF